MATLHTPDIHPVETFDPINNHTVEFSYTGSQIAVSYTHLDVYKRQVLFQSACTLTSAPSAIPFSLFRRAVEKSLEDVYKRQLQ